MKPWVKACLIGACIFLVLGIGSIFIAYGIVATQGVLGEKVNRIGPYTRKPFNNNQRIEDMMDEQIRSQNILAAETTYDLENQKQKQKLQEQGIILKPGEMAHMKANENASTGYQWILDAASCPREVEVLSEFVAPETEEKEPCYDDDGEQTICPDFRPILGLPGVRLITITALQKGNCVFRMAYERPWQFTKFEEWNGIPVTIPIIVN